MNKGITLKRTILFLIISCCYVGTLFAKDYTTIKVGLESLYSNAKEIKISGQAFLAIGYYEEESGFSSIGVLDSHNVIIEKAKGQYIDTGGIYTSYSEAKEKADTLLGIPVYIQEGLFAVYQEADKGNSQTSNPVTLNQGYTVKDTSGKIIFIFNKAEKEIVFQGFDSTIGLHLTTVGNSQKYRGAIGIAGTSGITPYNILSIEEYLYGVVPCEMIVSWPKEALKAQAVAARSIAHYQYNRYKSRGYNVIDTTAVQAYRGFSSEDIRSNRAVDETRGQTIQYQGKVAEALYFSTSGGTTESASNLWGNVVPYLIGVDDFYETEPTQLPWTREITLEGLDNCLKKNNVKIGKAQGVQILTRTSSGRVGEMSILGTEGSYSLKGEKIRNFFISAGGALKSTLFTLDSSITSAPEQAPKSQVTVLSANGRATQSLSELTITNGTSLAKINKECVVQGANGKIELQDISSNGSNNVPSGETVWGDFTIHGKGFGHGVGMSQSGAKCMAQVGFDYIQILSHYYTGITVK